MSRSYNSFISVEIFNNICQIVVERDTSEHLYSQCLSQASTASAHVDSTQISLPSQPGESVEVYKVARYYIVLFLFCNISNISSRLFLDWNLQTF